MTESIKGLQKELFVECMGLIHEPGWELLKEENLTAFKAPVTMPFMNFVYGNVTLDAYQKIKEFYQGKPFFWLLTNDQNEQLLLEWGFKGPDLTFEMGLKLADYHDPIYSADLEVREIRSAEDLLKWIDVAASWQNIDPSFVDEFFTPWIKTGKFIPYLGFWQGKPAATSLVYCGQRGAAIYCLGTLPEFRRRGVGTAVTEACLKTAKNNNIDKVVLYGSQMGKSMYEKMGFQFMQTLREYSK